MTNANEQTQLLQRSPKSPEITENVHKKQPPRSLIEKLIASKTPTLLSVAGQSSTSKRANSRRPAKPGTCKSPTLSSVADQFACQPSTSSAVDGSLVFESTTHPASLENTEDGDDQWYNNFITIGQQDCPTEEDKELAEKRANVYRRNRLTMFNINRMNNIYHNNKLLT